MKRTIQMGLVGFAVTVLFCQVSFAHFGMLIPSDNMVMQNDHRVVKLQLSFSHPMEMVGMEMVKPKAVNVYAGSHRHDMTKELKPIHVMGHSAWQLDYKIKRPGVYIFYMEPTPYWEPAEDVFIIHHTKTVVAAFGDDEGWDTELGVPTEIVPLSKPFGLYAGNVFQGMVKLKGEPVPYAEVEVEFYNHDKTAKAPTDYMVTQTIKADPNGIFTYAVPTSGWWGFAALNAADFKLKTNTGEEKGVELGAVLWVHFNRWQSK
jgi:cobalt/nickel transport protein